MLSRDLTAVLNTAIQHLVELRPLSVSMGNAIKFLKLQARTRVPCAHAAGRMQSNTACAFRSSLFT